MDIETTLAEMRREQREGMNAITDSLGDLFSRTGRIEVAVARLEEKSHTPSTCDGLSRHEKDHDRTDGREIDGWKKIQLWLAIVLALIGIGTFIFGMR